MTLMAHTLTEARSAQWLLVGLAVVAVAVADVFLKKATAQNDLSAALRSPWFWGAVGLYLLQIGFFTYAFVSCWWRASCSIAKRSHRRRSPAWCSRSAGSR